MLKQATFTALLIAFSIPSLEAHFLWQVDTEVPSYLYGTVHSSNASVRTLPGPVIDALRKSDSFHPEIELSPENLGRLTAAVFAPTSTNLEQEVSAELWNRLERSSGQMGIPAGFLRRIPLQLTPLLFATPPGSDFKTIVDVQVYELAKENGLTITQLETIEEQVGIFRALDRDQAVVLLEEALDEFEENFPTQKKILASYATGDLEGLMKLLDEDLSKIDIPGLAENLIDRRNRMMVDRLLPYLEEGGAFVAVGVAHMPGESGILSLLEQQGYTITRVRLR